jgi:citrate lyase subunit beta/citryl-CoA lyase
MLFVPAHRLDWVRKLDRTLPDAAILDLEDAVAPELKPRARELLTQDVECLTNFGITAFVRLNALGAGCEEDVSAAILAGVTGVILPKVDKPADVVRLDTMLAQAEHERGLVEGSIGIVPLPETASGLWHAYEIAAASRRVSGLITAVAGVVRGDVARAAGFRPTEEGLEQLFLQSRVVLASRAAGAMYPMGTLLPTRLNDLGAVRGLALRARQIGFSGAVLVHPSHIAVANEIFMPDNDEVAQAHGLVTAMSAAVAQGQGAVAYCGGMVDAAMVPPALELIAAHARFQERDASRHSHISQ